METLAHNGAWIAGLLVVLWLVSIVKRDASIIDPYWSVGIALVCWRTAIGTNELGPGQILLLSLVTLWAFRLWAYLTYRAWGEEEDFRYQAFRNRFGPQRYWWISLFQVFALQGVLMLIISAPLQVALSASTPLGPAQLVGGIVFVIGFLFEAVGDWQLLRFKADPSNQGKVLDRGLWRYTRHPNYFGEALLWWGLWICVLDQPYGIWTAFAPLLMTVLLLKVSGVSLLEPALARRRPDYAAYVARTPAFFPWPPRVGVEQD
jgi:steroid 5-alpha reductase family enzyme